MDTTAFGIALGVLAALAYALTRAVRQHSFDVGSLILVLLAGFSVPAGGLLIVAAWSGNPASLPSSWREYVTVGGAAAMGLSLHYLVQAFRNVWPKRATPATEQAAKPADPTAATGGEAR